MESNTLIELIGYTASVILVISMMMSSFVKLRIVNLVGAFLFSVYGFIIGSYPVGFLNGFIVIINIYQVYRLKNQNKELKIIQLPVDSEYVKSFVKHYKKEIKHYYPDFEFETNALDTCIAILRNMNIAAIILGKRDENQWLNIKLDFVVPQYRDTKVGQHLFVLNKQYFKDKGFSKIIIAGKNRQREQYLREVGFLSIDNDKFELKL